MLTEDELGSLERWLVERDAEARCDETLTHTELWALASGRHTPELGRWLGERGGCCDCEVLYNVCGVAPRVGDAAEATTAP